MDSGSLWPLALYFAVAVAIAAAMLSLSWVLGERHDEPATGQPYESGIVSTGSARLRFEPQFYLVAMFFVIFDLEAIFLFAWAAAIHAGGWQGYVTVVGFVGVLVVALVYLWRIGALDIAGLGGKPRRSSGVQR